MNNKKTKDNSLEFEDSLEEASESENKDFSEQDINDLFLEKLRDTCKNCNQFAEGFIKLDTGMRLSLQTVLETPDIPQKVCESCYQNLIELVSKGTKLRARKIAQQEFKRSIWKNRMNFVKRAQEDFSKKNYSSAAIHYEKYLQSLKIGFGLETGDLVPSLFKGELFRKEYLIVTHVYLDLFKIYDFSNRSQDRLGQVAKQITLFGNHPTVRAQTIRKLHMTLKSTNNRELIYDVLKVIDKNSARCFIATAAFESPSAPEVQLLCSFRDCILSPSKTGRQLIVFYYKTSPPIAKWLDNHLLARTFMRKVLDFTAFSLRHIFKLEK